MGSLIKFSIILFLGGVPFCASAQFIEVQSGQRNPTLVAVLNFEVEESALEPIANNISNVIRGDLRISGVFNLLSETGFLDASVPFNVTPNFSNWRAVGAQALVNGRISYKDDKLAVSFRLWDVSTQKVLVDLVFYTERQYWRRIAHLISDAIYKRFTGEKSFFDTRMAYVSETGPQQKRKKTLAVMDYDGANGAYLTRGEAMILNPKFSPNQHKLAYLVIKDYIPKVYILDMLTGKQKLLGSFPGLTFSPEFSPDGDTIILSQSLKGATSLYKMQLSTGKTQRLTYGPQIDTSPSISPDGSQLVFNSDRSGRKQLYTMDIEGKNIERISFGEGSYATPVWSPRGDLIAFTKAMRGIFYIGVMRPDGSNERLLASGFMVESPTWAPNGHAIAFTRQGRTHKDGSGGRARLNMVDIFGDYEIELPTQTDATDPAWSSPLPTRHAS